MSPATRETTLFCVRSKNENRQLKPELAAKLLVYRLLAIGYSYHPYPPTISPDAKPQTPTTVIKPKIIKKGPFSKQNQLEPSGASRRSLGEGGNQIQPSPCTFLFFKTTTIGADHRL